LLYIDDISRMLILLIRMGAAFRVIFCLIRLMTAEEETAQYKKRINNTLVFYITAELVFIIKDIIIYYYS
jgi:hypothetical protein